MSRAGVTLVELAVVIVVLGLLSAMSGLALSRLRPTPDDPRADAVRRARTVAIDSGRAVKIGGDTAPALFLPDGRTIGLGLDPLTGELIGAPR